MIPLLFAILPLSPQDTDYAPEVEVNRYHCPDDGKYVFTQVIFYEYRQGSRVIKDWRLCREQRDYSGVTMRWGKNSVSWNEGDRLCVVRFEIKHESMTNEDVEIQARHVYPKEWRSGLFQRGPR